MEKLLFKFYYYRFLLEKIFRRIFKLQKNVYVWTRAGDYFEIWSAAAKEIGAVIEEVDRGMWKITRGDQFTYISLHLVALDNPVVLNMAGNKKLIYKLFGERNIPVSEHCVYRVNELDKMKQFIDDNKGMFVVKPANGTSSGIGVSTHLKNYAECRRATALASLSCDEFIIEKLIPGEIYRMMFLNGEMLHASRRKGLWLTGNGKSSVIELLRKYYKDKGKSISNPIDRDLESTLSAQQLSPDSVLEVGQKILCKTFDCFQNDKEEIRTVYTHHATDSICSEIQQQAREACLAVGSEFAGVDIITLDPGKPLEEIGGVIGEINTTPGMHHHWKLEGSYKGPSALSRTLEYLLARR